MLNIELISTIIGIFAGIGIMVGGCGYAYSSWKNGKNHYKDELIADLKATFAVKEEQIVTLSQEKSTLIASHQLQLNAMQRELTELRVKFEEESKKLEEYRAILQNRDPQTLEILTEIKNGIAILNENQKKSKKALIIAADKVAENK